MAQLSRRDRPVLVRNTSSRLGRCSSIDAQRHPGARPARAGSAGSRPRRPRRTGGRPRRTSRSCRTSRACAAALTARHRQADPDDVAGDLAFELGRRARGDDLAVVHDGDAVAERVRLVQVVRGDEDGHALGAQPAHLVPHVRAALRVEAGGRLVEEDHLGLVDDAERDVDPAPLAARVGLALAVGVLGELEASSDRAARRSGVGLADAVEPGLQHQLLARGRVVPGAAALGHVPDPAAHLARVACAGRRRRWWPSRRPAR